MAFGKWRQPALAVQTNKLQGENTTLRMRMAELEGANKNLAREAYGWRTRYEQLAQHSGLPSSQHLQPPPQQPQQQPQQSQQQQQGSYVSPGQDRRVRTPKQCNPHRIGWIADHHLLAWGRM